MEQIHRLRLALPVLFSGLVALTASPAAAAGPPKGGDKKKGGGLTFLQFQTLTATVAGERGRRAVLTLEVGLDIPDEKLRAHAELSEPRLRASFSQTLRVYAAGLAPAGLPDADYIGRQLQRDADRVLGKSGATLLLGTILVN
ncbi:hypothetical protein [Phenylobacterium sp.]|uniref:hypothetical protein n=1 Tax=Phenylobacterium sp. TaxID=1871053 RepID=UPI002731014A|nr:hypothetical protein [Phenylobacterium sp.]MDP1872825.1 hypothetical protein [Phenylobacterium sp.]MDP3299285.1 hypothetical protein [Phenylobacterium sp.]MDP3489699.1 hypothetical protein [Phenylobacterium sp.]